MVACASDTSFPRHTSTSRHWWLRRCGGFGFWFLRTIVTRMPETALVSFRTLAFFFPLVTNTFSFFNGSQSLSILDHCSCFNSPVSGVKVSEAKFLFFSPFSPLSFFFFLIIGHRYLLMNLHVVQFQYSFELHRLTYSQFVQTFQDIVGWNLRHR